MKTAPFASTLFSLALSAYASAAPVAKTPQAKKTSEALMNPHRATAQAPKTFKVRFTTTKGDFELEVHRDWANRGADRFYNLVQAGFFADVAFFRVVDGFMVQFGIHGTPAVAAKWREANIPDDPPAGVSNQRGYVSFATAGPDTRTTQMFINYVDNGRLDSMGFTPFAKVISGMDVVDKLYKGYGESAPSGDGPEQGRLQAEGNAYLKKSFPQMDYIKSAKLVK